MLALVSFYVMFDKVDKHGKRVEVPGGVLTLFTHCMGERGGGAGMSTFLRTL